MMTLFDDEQILEAYAKNIDDNATHREAKKTAERMIKDEISLEKIARYVPSLSMDELKELEREHSDHCHRTDTALFTAED